MPWQNRTVALLLLALACDDTTEPGSGHDDATTADAAGTGSGGKSGSSSIDASSGAGGSAGKAGTSGTGASSNSGGSSGTGGSAGSSGTGGSAGSSGTGGSAGNGGSAGSAGAVATYTTDFDLGESPLSESGAWYHNGLDWTLVDTASGIAFGTQALGVTRSGPAGYNDSYAYLSGFPPNQRASGVVHLGTIDTTCTHEVEVLLRWADAAHNARGYECNLAFDGSYAEIVRWNGPVGDYTYLNRGSVPGGVHEGDILDASIVGDRITLSVNGTTRASARDATFATGNPGIGFWRGTSGCGSRGDFGFTRFTASAVVP